MRNSRLFSIFMVTAAIATAACHDLDNEQSRDPRDAEDAEYAAGLRESDRLCPHLWPKSSGAPVVDWMEIPLQTTAPRGKTCCVECDGDFTYNRYNLGKADKCDARAKAFCKDNRGRLIDVKWDFC